MKRFLAIAIVVGGVAFGQGSKIPTYKELKYPPMGQVKIPDPVQATLPNGMRVFLLENHELPLISGSVTIHTGNLFDPADKKGLSSIMAEVMRSGGTKAKTGDQLDVELEDIAASVESGMDETSASVGFSALKESTDTAMAIFKDVLTNPEFRQDKLDLSLTQARSGIARRNDEPDGIADRELSRILYGPNTSYGWQVEYADLANIKREDLQAFYRRYYFPKNMMLEVYGDFNAADMKDKLEKLFADWKVDQPPVPAFPKVNAPAAPGVYLAEKADVTQTFFSIGELGGMRSDPDYAALEVAADILGQGFTSRLMKEIRTKLGYAYNIAAVWSAQYDHPGTFRIVGSTKSMTTVETIQAIQAEVQKIRTEQVTEKELQDAKDAALNGFVFNFASPAQTLSRAVRYAYYGYPKDFVFTYQKALGAVTRADVLRVAQAHFKPENLAIVMVGNPKDFGKSLTTVGKVTPIDLTIPEPKPEIAAGDSASQSRGKVLLERAQQAMGGADKLAAVKDWTRTLTMVQDPSAGGMTVKETTRMKGADQFRQDQQIPGMGNVAVYSDGKTGWLAMPQGTMAMPAEVLKQAKGEMFRGLASVVLSTRESSRTVNAVGPNSVQISTTDGLAVKVDFDPGSGLPVSETYTETAQTGPSEVVETFSDWREAGGIKQPFKISIQQGGKKAGEETVAEYQFNTGLKAEDLSKKP